MAAMTTTDTHPLILVTASTGKTGRRVADRLDALGLANRRASRRSDPPFDWEAPATWPAALDGVTAVYLAYAPELAAPGAAEVVAGFCAAARRAGVETVVLLAGRGEEGAEAAEAAVQASGMRWTIVRAAVFAQNFSEDFLAGAVAGGELFLPVPDVAEPFVDVEDLADVAVAALADPAHHGRTYDVTGPELLTFAEATGAIAAATGRPLRVTTVGPEEYRAGAVADGVPEPLAAVLTDLFVDIFDGRNATLGDGTLQALGRPARPFAGYVRDAAESGAWPVDAVDAVEVGR